MRTPEQGGISPENKEEKTIGLEEYLTSKIKYRERHDLEESLGPAERHIMHLADALSRTMGFERSGSFVLELDKNSKETGGEIFDKVAPLIRKYYEEDGFEFESRGVSGCYKARKGDQEIDITMDAYGYPPPSSICNHRSQQRTRKINCQNNTLRNRLFITAYNIVYLATENWR